MVERAFRATETSPFKCSTRRGPLIATATPNASGASVVHPAVAGETYFLTVVGAGNLPSPAINVYSFTVTNTPAPVPNAIVLDPADDTGMMDNDNITREDEGTITIEADLTNVGIPVLTAAEATAGNLPGAAVEVFVDGISVGFADPIPATNNDLFSYVFAAGELQEGVNLVKAAVVIIDPTTASARSLLSAPLVLRLDQTAPPVPAAFLHVGFQRQRARHRQRNQQDGALLFWAGRSIGEDPRFRQRSTGWSEQRFVG